MSEAPDDDLAAREAVPRRARHADPSGTPAALSPRGTRLRAPLLVTLWALLAKGGRRRLVSGLERSQGLCLEQLIEERLGIYAQTVPGAVE